MEDAQRSHNQGHVFAVVQDGLGRVVLAQQAHQHPCRMRVHHAWPWSWPWHVITQSKQCAIAIPTRHRSDMACVREVSASKSKSHVHFRPGVIDTHASQVMTINQIELKSYALCNACKLAIARHCGLPSFTCFVLVAHSTSLSLSRAQSLTATHKLVFQPRRQQPVTACPPRAAPVVLQHINMENALEFSSEDVQRIEPTARSLIGHLVDVVCLSHNRSLLSDTRLSHTF
jgi:hypothetical protein